MVLVIAQTAALFTHVGLAAAGAAAVSIPIAIHLLSRLRRRPQPWGAMRFLMEAYRRHRHRLQFEQLLLLLVRCLLVLTLGMALAGPMLGSYAQQLGLEGPGRLIYLVIDDSLSAQVTTAGDRARFERLRAAAQGIVAQLKPNDHVSIYLAAQPGRMALPPGADRAQVEKALAQLQPRFSRGDLQQVLLDIDQDLARQPAVIQQVYVALLSDFATPSIDFSRGHNLELPALKQRDARLLVSRPASPADNVQIQQLAPRRHMILAPAGAVAVPVTIQLRRFVGEGSSIVTSVNLNLFAVGSDVPLATVQRQHRWLPGQTQASLSIDLPVDVQSLTFSGPSGRAAATAPAPGTAPADGQANAALLNSSLGSAAASGQLIIAAQIDADSLAADNQRFATVELRRHLLVGMIDSDAGALPAADPQQPLDPRRWIEFALNPDPDSEGGSGLETRAFSAAQFDEGSIAELDAAVVLRPDLLGDRAWLGLKRLAQSGGVVWIVVPPSGAASLWAQSLVERLGLKWQLGLEPLVAKGPAAATGWNLAGDQPCPEPLGLLASDWAALLAPVRVQQRLTVQGQVDGEQVWLRTAGSDATGGGGKLLTLAPLGDGYVLLLATAVDSQWSNLPTKPLFVPLWQESLRSLLGEDGQARRLSAVICGQRPALGRGWNQAQRLVLGSDQAEQTVALERVGDSLVPQRELESPGLYRAVPGGARALAVNAEADAGDTRAIDSARLADYLARLGNWQWLDDQQPAKALEDRPQRASLGWPLLWAALALLLLETCLARWFSHARPEQSRPPLWRRWFRHSAEGTP